SRGNGPVTLVTNKPRPQLAFFTEDNEYEIHNEPLIEMESLAGAVSKKKLIIKNTGNQEALLKDVSISGANFYLDGKMDALIRSGGQARFDVVYYSPIEAKTTSAMLMVKSDDPFSSSRLTRFNG